MSCSNSATMASADFSLLSFDLSPIVTARFVAVATGGETSRDKTINFPCVLPDLLYGITVDFWAFPIHSSVTLPNSALYQVSVRQYFKFVNGFFQIQGHP